jgi:hypothetical protein
MSEQLAVEVEEVRPRAGSIYNGKPPPPPSLSLALTSTNAECSFFTATTISITGGPPHVAEPQDLMKEVFRARCLS